MCGITGEVIKTGGKVAVKWMHSIMNVAWKTETLREEWRKTPVIPVHKKGIKCRAQSTVATVF